MAADYGASGPSSYELAQMYLARNPDLWDWYQDPSRNTEGINPLQAALSHYTSHGSQEGRPLGGGPSYQVPAANKMAPLMQSGPFLEQAAHQYLISNPDVMAWANSEAPAKLGLSSPMEAALYHYYNTGAAEGRVLADAGSDITAADRARLNALSQIQFPSYTAPPEYTPYQREAFQFEADPGYQFRLQQGQDAINREQAARGNFFSGQALQAASDYNQGMATNEYDRSFNRYLNNQDFKAQQHQTAYGLNYARNQDTYKAGYGAAADQYMRNMAQFDREQALANQAYGRAFNEDQSNYNRWLAQDQNNWNRTAQLAGIGLNAAGGTAAAGNANANLQYGAAMSQGQAQAGGYINSNNAWQNALSGIYQTYRQGQWMNQQQPQQQQSTGSWV